MTLLLDTQLFLWVTLDSKKLSRTARKLMADADAILISAVSITEAAIKASIGKLSANPDELVSMIARSGFRELPLTATHGALLAKLPAIHRDPFDRLLIAQALCEGHKLVTADELLTRYSDIVVLV